MSDKLPRDVFIDYVYERAKNDKRIVFLNADLGAIALDKFREELPEQFIHTGISEQTMMNWGLGMAQTGNIVLTYAMDSFVMTRAMEQAKVAAVGFQSLNEKGIYPAMNIIGIGCGFGYGEGGPTHYTTEMTGWARGIAGMEILSPSDSKSAMEAARISCEVPGLRYIRLDRQFLPDIHGDNSFSEKGIAEIDSNGESVCIFSTGYTTHTALEARKMLKESLKFPSEIGIADIFRINPFNEEAFWEIVGKYPRIMTLEENFQAGGIGEMIAGKMSKSKRPLEIIAMPDKYYFENASNIKGGSRSYIHKQAGIDAESVAKKILEFW